MTDDELELGLPPSTKKVRVPKPLVHISFMKYRVRGAAPYCADCLDKMPKVGGWPKNAVTRASYVMKSPAGKRFLCAIHKQEREDALQKEREK